jgi:hypothetical protein
VGKILVLEEMANYCTSWWNYTTAEPTFLF